jgi:hypothetical protein
MSVKPMAGFDMDNRDPNNLNEHLQVSERFPKFGARRPAQFMFSFCTSPPLRIKAGALMIDFLSFSFMVVLNSPAVSVSVFDSGHESFSITAALLTSFCPISTIPYLCRGLRRCGPHT